MTAGGQDMSDSGDVPASMSDVANDVLTEQRTRRYFRTVSLVAAIVTLATLLWAMGTVVRTFTSEFRVLALDARIELPSNPAAVAVAKPSPVAASPSAVAEAAAVRSPEPVRATVSLGAFTTSLVALVSALVLAATVLAIALVRASFTLSARGDDSEPAAPAKGGGVALTLPTIEFVKAFGESLQTALKGVQGLAKPGD